MFMGNDEVVLGIVVAVFLLVFANFYDSCLRFTHGFWKTDSSAMSAPIFKNNLIDRGIAQLKARFS